MGTVRAMPGTLALASPGALGVNGGPRFSGRVGDVLRLRVDWAADAGTSGIASAAWSGIGVGLAGQTVVGRTASVLATVASDGEAVCRVTYDDGRQRSLAIAVAADG